MPASKTTQLLLVNPQMPENFWSFSWAFRNIVKDKKHSTTPLGLAIIAALTPKEWEITIVDENVEPMQWDFQADIVGVCGMSVQFPRQKEILTHFANKGCYIVAGGSYASLCPEEYFKLADTVIAGEAEYIWPQFCRDFSKNATKKFYQETGNVDLQDSPAPRNDLLKLHLYQTVSMQFSRGCPFRCEFCDIIVTFGRKPRTKKLSQIEQELDLLRHQGTKNVSFVDDNLIGHIPKCKELLEFLIDYQQKHKYSLNLGCESSLNLAMRPDLMALMQKANFHWIFTGIESPNFEALKETKKEQNTRQDLLQTLEIIYSYGLDIYASFIVGFDADDSSVFASQYRFIVDSGLIFSSICLLVALPKTPLYKRLEQENRLRSLPQDLHHLWFNFNDTNVTPVKMSYDEMVQGICDLRTKLVDEKAIYQKIRNKMRYIKNPRMPYAISWLSLLNYTWRFLFFGIFCGGPKRWFYFICSLAPVVKRPKNIFFVAINWSYAIAIKSLTLQQQHNLSLEKLKRSTKLVTKKEIA